MRNRHGGTPPPEVVLIPASSIVAQPVRWAWQDRIPLGMVTLMVGVPGLGKSTILLELGARLSTGTLPGDLEGTPIAVAIATAEDALAEVVIPRLMAAKADRSRVHVLRVRRDGVLGGMVLPDDLKAIRAQVVAHEARLLVVDPLVAHLPGALDAHRDQHVRRALAPLAQFAEETGAAIVAVMHLNKSQTTDVLTKIGGSVGFGAACRSMLLLAADPEDREGPTRILAHGKCNVGPPAASLRLRVEGRDVVDANGDPIRDPKGRPIRTAAIAWCGEAVGVLASDLIAVDAEEKDAAVREAMTVLQDVLSHGPVASPAVEGARKQARLSERAWKAAKRRLRVRSVKLGFGGGWAWALPVEDGPPPSEEVQASIFGEIGPPAAEKPPPVLEEGRRAEDGRELVAVAAKMFGATLVAREPGEEG